jgi:triacylglycerol lipase
MLQWVEAHIAQYHGNPDRMFIWAHSAGNGPLGTYIGRPELYGPKGVGVIGVIFMSGAFDIAPVRPPQNANGGNFRQLMATAGKTCHEPGGAGSTAGVLPGVPAGHPGGPSLPAPGRRAGPAGGFVAPDPAVQLAHSSLPALKQTSVRIMLANASLDPGVDPSINAGVSGFNQALHDALCAAGPDHCPTMLVSRGESHMSEVYSIDTPDKTVSGPVLAFIHRTLRAAATVR